MEEGGEGYGVVVGGFDGGEEEFLDVYVAVGRVFVFVFVRVCFFVWKWVLVEVVGM